MKKLKAWLAAMARIGAPAADVNDFEDFEDVEGAAERWRAVHEASLRLTALRNHYPLEMGSRRFG